MNTAALRSIRLASSLLIGAVFVSALALALVLTSAPTAYAGAIGGTRYVAKTGTDSGTCTSAGSPCKTIPYAIGQAIAGETVSIAGGTYTSTSQITVTKALIFIGAGADSTFVDGSNTGRVFSVTATSATFVDLTIQNGKVISDSGAGIYASGTLTLTNVAVLNNRSESRLVGGNVDGGGGVRVMGDLYVTGSRFENNAVPTPLGEGGAIRSNAAVAPHPSVRISGTVFISNTAKYGGAVSAGGSTWITNTQVASNTATTAGGGVYVGSSSPSVTLSGCMIEHNTTLDGKGGGAQIASADLMISGCIIQHNTTLTGTGGGGVYVQYGLTVAGTQFIGNKAEGPAGSGAGLYAVNYASARTVAATDFISNTAGQYGGGLYVGGGPVTLTNTRFISNTSFLVGGGARLYGATTVVDSEFTSNSAISSTGGSGGGLYLDSTATVTGTDFSGNWSGNLGGGLYAYGAATLTNSQFTGNSAAAGGGAYFYGAATLVDAPFADNTATNDGGGLFARASLLMTDTQLIRNSAANGGGIYVSGNTAGASRMVNVLLAANSAITNGAALYLYSAGSGSTARSATIVHTTIASPTVGAGQAIFVGKPAAYAPTVNITNTLIASYTTGISVTAGALVSSDYNYFNNAPTSVAIGSHSISGTEHYLLFVDAAADNYRPVLGSPAPTHGRNQSVITDLDGVTRSDPPTIGAYEGTPYPNVWLNKAVTPITDVPYHGVVTYTLDLHNTGSLTDTVRLTDTLPAGVTFGAWVTEPAGVIRAGNAITWTGVITDLEAAITLVFTATHTGNYGDVIANTAWFSGSAQTGSAAASFSVVCSNAIVVQNTGNSGLGSLRQAIADVCPGGTITFAPALTASGAATVTLTSGQLTVAKNVTITGPGADLLAVSGNNASRVFYVNSAVAAAISGLTIRDGNSSGDGGGIYSAGALTLATSRVVSNTAANGGGLYQEGSSAGRVVNTLFARNTAVTNGAAMYLGSSGTVDVLHNTIANPTVGAGAAIYVGGGTVNITNTIVASYTVGVSAPNPLNVTSDYNLFYNAPTAIAIGSHSLTGLDPLFVDPTNGDYHLGADSAAVDAGVAAGVTTDYDGDTRPQGPGYDIGYDELLQRCKSDTSPLSTGVDYTFGSPAVTLNFSNLGDVNCAAGLYFPRAQPHATGTVGHGVGGDHFWQITARTAGGATATGFTALLTAPTGGASDPKLCFYNGEGVYGWDCAGTVNGGNISRTITHFSDWAVGNLVGPTAVTLQALRAKPVGGASALAGLIAGLIAGLGVWLFTRRVLSQR